MKNIKVAIIGAGLRGMNTYGDYIKENIDYCEIVAVVETKKGRRDLFVEKHKIKEEYVFDNIDEFFKKDKMADAVIISTSDDMHFKPSKLALEKGYHILLEKPMANTLDEIVHLEELCGKYNNQIFMICHVLRYTPFFNKLKEIVDSKALGELISIQHNENIGYFHYAHSYTRGNWRNSSDTAPLILTKSCHDMDILLYLTGSSCEKISSFGNLKHFNSKNFRNDMSEYCFDCEIKEKCPYYAQKIYTEKERKMNHAVHMNPTKDNLVAILEKGPYGKCVYKCDNNVVDNMVSILQFENKVTATFNLSAFTKECDRTIKLMFSHGEVGGSMMENIIKVKRFGENKEVIIRPSNDVSGHGGGDSKLLEDFIRIIKEKNYLEAKSSAKKSIESHIMAFAAEYSRISDEVVYVREFHENAIDMTNEIENKLL